MKRLALLLIVIIGLVSAGCTSPAGTGTAAPVTGTPAPDSGYALNLSVRPGDDFYAYVNDAWIAEHPVPADKKSYTTFDSIEDKVDNDLHALLLNASNATPGADRNITLIGQFYRAGMDNVTIERDGLAPLSGDLAMIDAIQSGSDLTNATIILLEHGSNPVYYYVADINPRNSSEMIPYLEQGGIGLPDRDYYIRNDTKSREIQDAYRNHITNVFKLAGETDGQAAADAETVYAMEKTLAQAQNTAEDNMNPEKTTNLFTLSELEAQYPATGWEKLASIPGEGTVSQVNVRQPGFAKALDTLLKTAPLDDWKVYLRYELINEMSPYLGEGFEKEHFAFYSTTLNGVTAMEPRWKRVVHTESDILGDLVGREYVAQYVDPRTRGMVSDMFASMKQAFDNRIANLTWMSSSTKTAAREKLAAMGQKIAYPDKWTDYSGLTLSDSYAANVRSASAYNLIHGSSGLSQVGKPVDRTIWFMSPQMVNAYYDWNRNEIVFPAAILQEPFFDPDADAAQNYGALGGVIGHEMTHGFDTAGGQFDKDGNLKDWWTPEDKQRFDNSTQLLVQEYNNFQVLPGLSINGNLTLAENIADFGGITIAYDAWKAQESQSPDALTEKSKEREFFYSAAHTWRGSFREEALRIQVYTDPHSNGRYRVNGAFFNVPQFYDAFPEIQPGDALYRNVSERPVIW
ncbi:MAG TPA: M13 family metallopeptidase [Methanoregula sp.]|mgnify:CR=1 FL=1|nr:M13 family metallopeptidase [Methanoregula sp.]